MTYGCFNRAPFRTARTAPDGYYLDGTTRTPRMVSIKHVNTTDCQYLHSTLGKADLGCTGCKWKTTEGTA
jgi:hypothetical protein